MSINKSKKSDARNLLEESQEGDSPYMSVHEVLQICSFWSKNNADIANMLAMDHPEEHIKIVKKSERAILEIKFINADLEEKIIQIEIKLYE